MNDAEADEEGRRGTRKNISRSLAVRENGSSIPASFCASCLLYTHANNPTSTHIHHRLFFPFWLVIPCANWYFDPYLLSTLTPTYLVLSTSYLPSRPIGRLASSHKYQLVLVERYRLRPWAEGSPSQFSNSVCDLIDGNH